MQADERGDVPILVDFGKEYEIGNDQLPLIDGLVPVRLDIEEQYRERIVNQGFEAKFFVDGILVYENEVGYLPMNWSWDTRGLNPGPHYLTVNLLGIISGFGIATRKVRVTEQSRQTQ